MMGSYWALGSEDVTGVGGRPSIDRSNYDAF